MEYTYKETNNNKGGVDHLVYAKEGNVVLIAKLNEKIYTPNFSFVCITNAEMTNLRNLANEAKVNGTDRVTGAGRQAKDYVKGIYSVAIINIDNNAKLVDIAFKDATHPLYGLSVKWIEQANGAIQFATDSNYTYFPPSGNSNFDLGFKRQKVKLGDSTYDKANKTWNTTYDKESYLTIPSMGNSEGFLRASRGIKLLEDVIEFAGQHMTPVVNQGVDNDLMNAIGAGMPL